jgi:hypothetical protein
MIAAPYMQQTRVENKQINIDDPANPFIFTNADLVTPTNTYVPCGGAATPRNTEFKVSLNIGQVRFNQHSTNVRGIQHHRQQHCSLVVPCYSMLPQFESTYLSSGGSGQKKIEYIDILSVQHTVEANSRFDRVLTTGIVNPTKLVICCQLGSKSNAGGTGVTAFSPMLSPYSTSPATTCPTIFENFNVKLSGNLIYTEAMNFSFEQYIFEIGKDEDTAPISRREYESGLYQYFVIDLKRYLPDVYSTSQSISISGTSKNLMSVDMICFIEYEASVVLDLYTGKILKA